MPIKSNASHSRMPSLMSPPMFAKSFGHIQEIRFKRFSFLICVHCRRIVRTIDGNYCGEDTGSVAEKRNIDRGEAECGCKAAAARDDTAIVFFHGSTRGRTRTGTKFL